ncbi:MAG: signal peptidase II [Synergistaceae bacterium]|nr:signal peptidase II [Synergistaceae bacterium]
MKIKWIVFVILLVADRAAKCWAKSNLPDALRNAPIGSLFLHRNEGISFSLMKNFPHAALAISVLGMGILAFLCAKIAPVRKSFGVIFLWAGAAGNLADRLLYGYVIDWIYVGEYVNMADLWLAIGGIAAFAEIVRAGKSL